MKKIFLAALVAAVAIVAAVVTTENPQPMWQDHYKKHLAQEYMHIAWEYDGEVGDLVGLLKWMEKEGYYNNRKFTQKVLDDITTPEPTEYTVEREVKIGENTYEVVWDKYKVLPSGITMLIPYEPEFRIIRTVYTFSDSFIAEGEPTPLPLYATTK